MNNRNIHPNEMQNMNFIFVIQKRVILLCILCCILIQLPAQIKRMDDEVWNAIDGAVAAQFALHDLKGISVAVVYGGQIAYANAMGDKNDDGDPFTIGTKSLLASVSKPITAVLAMRLVENGDIQLQDAISQYVSEFSGSGITINDLLCHQSGISHYSNCPGGYAGPFNADDSYAVVADCEICLTPPGSGTIYTTFGTTLLGVIISYVGSDVYGLGYSGLYNAWIKNPGNLTTLDPAWNFSDPDLAQGSEGEDYWDDIGWKLPGGGFISNISDLANFARGLLNNTFISQATFDLMKVIQPTSGSPNHTCGELDFNYGLGFSLTGDDDDFDFRMSHSGANDEHGYSSYFAVYPNANAAIVMLTNTKDAGEALRDIRDGIETLVLCPEERDFTNDISWTEPRIFEGEVITGRSEITSSNTDAYIFDAEDYVRLMPGFKVPAGKVFRAIVYDGCGGEVVTD